MADVGMLSYIWGSTQTATSIVVHQCALFCNNPCLVHKCAVRNITKYLKSTCTYVDLPDGNIRLSTYGVVQNPDKEKAVECYVDAGFAG